MGSRDSRVHAAKGSNRLSLSIADGSDPSSCKYRNCKQTVIVTRRRCVMSRMCHAQSRMYPA